MIWGTRETLVAEGLLKLPTRRNKWAEVATSTTAASVANLNASSIDGTRTLVKTDTGAWFNQATAASSGALSGVESSAIFQPRYRPIMYGTIETGSDITNCRFWVGATPDGGLAFNGSDDLTGANTIMLRYSSGSPNWQLVATSVSAAGTAVDTGIVVAASTVYNWRFLIDATTNSVATTIYAWIGTYNAPLSYVGQFVSPSTMTTGTDYALVAAVENKAASARAIRWKSHGLNME